MSTPRKIGMDWQRALTEHHRWLKTVVLSRLREPDAVDDVMQEVALAAVKQSAPMREEQKVGPWLYRLAVRHVLLYRRQQGRRRKLTRRFCDLCPSQTVESDNSDPLYWLLADEKRALIRQAINGLPARELEVTLLKYTEGWSYRQIAQHLGVTAGAVQSRLHRARRRLRNQLEALNVVEATQ